MPSFVPGLASLELLLLLNGRSFIYVNCSLHSAPSSQDTTLRGFIAQNEFHFNTQPRNTSTRCWSLECNTSVAVLFCLREFMAFGHRGIDDAVYLANPSIIV